MDVVRTCVQLLATWRLPAGIWKKYGLLCAHEQIMARIKPHQV